MERSQLLYQAMRGGYAVPAFNYSDTWELTAILEAAEEESAPVMTATNFQSITAQTPQLGGALGTAAAKMCRVPILNHLDHSPRVELCKTAIDCGYPSVMIDCSRLSLEENIANCREVTAYAHERGVIVEGELGSIGGNGDESSTNDSSLVNPADVRRFVEETDVDSLAIGIGNAHGFYKEKPKLRFDRLQEIRKKVGIPLVLHGGTGIPQEDIQKAIRLGISKINVGTQLHYTYLNTLRKTLQEHPGNNVFECFLPAREEIKKVVKGWIRVCLADGKANK